MKILIVDSLFSPLGGGQKIAYDTYSVLKRKGHNVFYWAMNKIPYFIENYEFSKQFTPYYSGTIDYIKNPIKYYFNYKALGDLQKFVDNIKPDIIHFQSFWGLTSAIFLVKTVSKKILTIHDARCCPATTLMCKNQYFCDRQYCKNGNFLPCVFNGCVNNSYEASIRRALASFIDKNNLKKIDKFITPSNALKCKMLLANYILKKEKITTINNFLNQNELSIVPNYINNGYFLYIGRLSKEKSVITLLQAMSELPRDIKLHIVGTGPEEENLKKYAEENKLHNIEFLGFKTGADIQDEYQNCIATILPCNWFEIFGMTNIESFANGKPVIASNIGGIPEIVEHNVNGLLFEPANVEQLRECILKYWNNPELVIEHGKKGYEKVLTHYTEDIYYEKLIKLYEETINEYKK